MAIFKFWVSHFGRSGDILSFSQLLYIYIHVYLHISHMIDLMAMEQKDMTCMSHFTNIDALLLLTRSAAPLIPPEYPLRPISLQRDS